MRPRIRDMLVDGKHVAETAWLAALIAAPLLFVPENPRPFEFHNTVLVRTLAIGLGCAALALGLAGYRRQESRIPKTQGGSMLRVVRRILPGPVSPLLAASILLLAANLASTALSVAPTVSFFGSTQRNQGVLTSLGYLAIFWLAAAFYEGKQTRQRGIFVVAMVGLVVSVYAIQQSLGLDPIPLDPSWERSRVASTLGNPVFLGAFLVLVAPLIAGRLAGAAAAVKDELVPPLRLLHLAALPAALVALVWTWMGGPGRIAARLLAEEGTGLSAFELYVTYASVGAFLGFSWLGGRLFRSRSLMSAGVHLAILSALLAALILTKSRGPAAGLAAAVLTLAALYAAAVRQRRLAIGLAAAATLGLAGLLSLWALDASGRAPLCADPTFGRIMCPWSDRQDEIEARTLIWRGSLELVRPHEPIHSTSSAADRWNALRPILGYGPETMHSVFPRVAPPELNLIFPPGVGVDRAHNGLLDTVLETGLLGLLAKLALVAVVLQRGLARLGILRGRRDWLTLAALTGVGSACGGLLVMTVTEPANGAAGVVSGAVVGLWATLIWSALRPQSSEEAARSATSLLSMIAIMASLTGLLIEQQFSFPTTTSQVYSWFTLGALVSFLGQSPSTEAEPAVIDPDVTGFAGMRSGAAYGSLLGAVLAVPSFAYLQAAAGPASVGVGPSPFDLIRSALLQQPGVGGLRFEPAIALGFLLVGVVGLTLFLGGRTFAPARSDQSGAILAFAASAAVVFSSGVVLIAFQVMATQGSPTRELTSLTAAGWLLAATIVGLAVVALVRLRRRSSRMLGSFLKAGMVLGLLAIAVLAVSINVNVLRSDALFRQAVTEVDPETLLQVARLAAERQPQRFAAFTTLGEVMAAAALEAEEAARRRALVQSAESAWRWAQASNPFDHRTEEALAGFHRALAGRSGAAGERLKELDAAIEHARTAIDMSPNSAYLHALLGRDLWTRAELRQRMGRPDRGDRVQARVAIMRAVDLDPGSCFVLATRALVASTWQVSVRLALPALHRLDCRRGADVLTSEAQDASLRALVSARRLAQEAGQEASLASEIGAFGDSQRTLAIVRAMVRRYQEEGRTAEAAQLEQFAAWLCAELSPPEGCDYREQ